LATLYTTGSVEAQQLCCSCDLEFILLTIAQVEAAENVVPVVDSRFEKPAVAGRGGPEREASGWTASADTERKYLFTRSSIRLPWISGKQSQNSHRSGFAIPSSFRKPGREIRRIGKTE
jgi:hypothetical protein